MVEAEVRLRGECVSAFRTHFARLVIYHRVRVDHVRASPRQITFVVHEPYLLRTAT